MLFSAIHGQESLKTQLNQRLDKSGMAHSVLFSENEAHGALALALATATRILCDNPSPTDACGKCRHCRKVTKLVHPDLHFVYPVIGSDKTSEDFWPQFRELLLKHPWFNLNQWLQHLDSENKQANIPAKECALILQKMSLKPFEAPNKVLIIWLPEYLGKDGNRLLKLLEEPPGHTYIFVVTRNKHKILNTILSRCQEYHLIPLSVLQISSTLTDILPEMNPDEISLISRMAEGSVSTALDISQAGNEKYFTTFRNWLLYAYKGDIKNMNAWSKSLHNFSKEQQKYFIRYSLQFLRTLQSMIIDPSREAMLDEQEFKTANGLKKILSLQTIQTLVKQLDQYHYYIERNANTKILFMNLAILAKKAFHDKAMV